MTRKKVYKRALALIMAVLLFAVSPIGLFADNVKGHWSEPYIKEAQNLRWVPRNLGPSFDVDETITRAEMALIIWQSYGAPLAKGECPYSDVKKGTLYADAFAFLYENDIVLGYGNGKAGASDYLNREMLFTVLARSLKMKAADATSYEVFLDAEDVSDWAREPISALYERYIVEGDENGYVHPLDNISFAELVKVLVVANREFKGAKVNPFVKNANAVVHPYAGDGPSRKTSEEIIETPETPLAPVLPSVPAGGSSGYFGSLPNRPPPGTQPPVQPKPVPKKTTAYVALTDQTLIVLEYDVEITSVSVADKNNASNTDNAVSVKYGTKTEWRAVLNGKVLDNDIIDNPIVKGV